MWHAVWGSESSLARDYGLAAAGVGLCTGLAVFLYPYLALTNLVMIYLFTVVIIAALLDQGPSIFASLVGVAVFAYLFVPDYYSFSLAHTEYAITLAVMLIVSILISNLGMEDIQQLFEATLIDEWFLNELREIVEAEHRQHDHAHDRLELVVCDIIHGPPAGHDPKQSGRQQTHNVLPFGPLAVVVSWWGGGTAGLCLRLCRHWLGQGQDAAVRQQE